MDGQKKHPAFPFSSFAFSGFPTFRFCNDPYLTLTRVQAISALCSRMQGVRFLCQRVQPISTYFHRLQTLFIIHSYHCFT